MSRKQYSKELKLELVKKHLGKYHTKKFFNNQQVQKTY